MRTILLAAGLVVAIVVAGCADKGGINETGYSDKPLVDRQGHKLKEANATNIYRAGHDFLIHNKPDKALRLYANIDARFPFSAVADQAALETISAHYQANQYKAAVDAADQFIKQRPQNEHIAYVYYMRGMSNFKSNKNQFLGAPADRRNVDHLSQAFSDFRIVVNNYYDSDYATDARQHMVAIRNRIAKFNLRIASYYLARHAYVAASRRSEQIIEQYQGAQAVPKALQIMEQSYSALGLPRLSADTRSILQTSFPQYLMHGSEFQTTADTADDDQDSTDG